MQYHSIDYVFLLLDVRNDANLLPFGRVFIGKTLLLLFSFFMSCLSVEKKIISKYFIYLCQMTKNLHKSDLV